MKTKTRRQRCDSCQVAYINGLRCHELGCPDAWKDYSRECKECGQDFQPDSRHQETCNYCLAPNDGVTDNGFDDTQ